MQVSIEHRPQSVVAITVELTAEEFERYYDQALSGFAKGFSADGFRPGQVPSAIVASRVGERHVFQEASRLALERTYPEVVKDAGLEPIGAPEAEVLKIARQNPFVYRVEVPIAPEVKLPDWRATAASVPRETVSVSDEEVAGTLARLQRSRARLTPVDRSAKTGDQLEVDFTVRSGGVALAGGESKNHPVVLGEGRFVPGFEEALIGLKSGDHKAFSLRVPDDFPQKAIAGKEVEFDVIVRRLDERTVPELTDEFARAVGNFSDLSALRDSVREGIKVEKTEAARNGRRERILTAIAEKTTVEVPDRLVEAEIERMVHDLGHTFEHGGANLADYLRHIGKTEDEFRKELQPGALKRAKNNLVIRAIAKVTAVVPSAEEIAERSRMVLAQFDSLKAAEETIDPSQVEAYTRGMLRTEKVLELLDAA